MPRRRRLLAHLASAVAATALIAGCGDDGGGDAAVDDAAVDDGSDTTDGELPDACGLVERDELEPLVGTVDPEADTGTSIDGLAYSQCAWEGDAALLIVAAVVDGGERFEGHAGTLDGEPLDNVGDEALLATGISSETRGGTGGRTVSARVGERTIVVALRLAGETPPDAIVPLAQAIIGRLG